jgi:hypothetical protein
MSSAAQKWKSDLALWAIPQEILDQAAHPLPERRSLAVIWWDI